MVIPWNSADIYRNDSKISGQKILLPVKASNTNQPKHAVTPSFVKKQPNTAGQPATQAKVAQNTAGQPKNQQPKTFNTITTRNDKVAPQPAPRPVAPKPRVEEENEVMKAVVLPAPITMRKLAEKYGTSVEAINALNSWAYRANQTLAKGSEVFHQTR